MGSMYYRKLTKIGTSYAIFLPIGWVRANELKDDDKLQIIEKNNKLTIRVTDETYPNYDF